MTPRRRRQLIAALVLAVLLVLPTIVAWLRAWTSADDAFASLPPSGPGWRSSSSIVGAMGRQYLRRVELAALTAALTATAAEDSGRVFVVADSGDSDGGPFPPHATHKDGRSVDILLPLRDRAGRATSLTTSFWNLWGYCWHLDEEGRVRGLQWEAKPVDLPVLGTTQLCPHVEIDSDDRVDFEATAQLLRAIDREARQRGLQVATIIIAPEYVDRVTSTPTGRLLGPLERRFVRHAVWVRHDEHVHVDFAPIHR